MKVKLGTWTEQIYHYQLIGGILLCLEFNFLFWLYLYSD